MMPAVSDVCFPSAESSDMFRIMTFSPFAMGCVFMCVCEGEGNCDSKVLVRYKGGILFTHSSHTPPCHHVLQYSTNDRSCTITTCKIFIAKLPEDY